MPVTQLEKVETEKEELDQSDANNSSHTFANYSNYNDEESEAKNNMSSNIKIENKQNIIPKETKKENHKETLKQLLENWNCNNKEFTSTTKFVKIDQDIICIVKRILFGSETMSIPFQWVGQSFLFNKNRRMRYGLIQNKGGLCGILATVQAFLIKSLLFDSETATVCPEPFCPTTSELKKALVHAISSMLWQAGQQKSCVLVKCPHNEDKWEDSELNHLVCQRFTSLGSLREELESSIAQFMKSDSNGCFLFILSAVLSSGIKTVVADINEEDHPLISQNGLCSLELVMLLLTGHAVSNVFDNTIHMGSYLLRGISRRSDIGFLTQYEHSNYQVGSNLKTPKYPIWVVNCENHYTVIFSDNMKLVSDWRAERHFPLYHYDSMQEYTNEEVKITVDTTGLYIRTRSEDEFIPPLEICLRTKWKDAAFHWSEIELH